MFMAMLAHRKKRVFFNTTYFSVVEAWFFVWKTSQRIGFVDKHQAFQGWCLFSRPNVVSTILRRAICICAMQFVCYNLSRLRISG